MSSIKKTMEARKKLHGDFHEHSIVSQNIKLTMRASDGWEELSMSQRESLEMIAHKIARILCGDPNHSDSWHDIAGYSLRIDEYLNE